MHREVNYRTQEYTVEPDSQAPEGVLLTTMSQTAISHILNKSLLKMKQE